MHIDRIRRPATAQAVPAAQPDPIFQLVRKYAREHDRFNAVEDATDEQTALDLIRSIGSSPV